MRLDGARTLNPGLLIHQIRWQEKVSTGLNSSGEDTYEWQEVVTCRAQIKTIAGRELEMARQRWAEAKYEITQHWFSGLRPDMQITWYIGGEERTLDVLDVRDPAGTGRVQVVIAKDHIE